MPDPISYLICTSHRSGSNLLCEILEKTGLAGRPQEYFYPGFYPYWFKTFQAEDFPDYLRKLYVSTTTPNGVFGAKLMGDHYFRDFAAQVRQLPAYQNRKTTTAEMLADCFPNLTYIWLTRRNVLRQAISLSKAVQSGIWRAAELKNHADVHPSQYNQAEINNCILNISMQQTSWQEYFDESGITPLTLVYEDFIDQPEDATRHILDHLGVAHPLHLVMGEFQERKLADSVSEEWFQQYFQTGRTDGSRGLKPGYHRNGAPRLITKERKWNLEEDGSELESRILIDYLADENAVKHLPFQLLVKALRSKIAGLLGIG